MRRLVQMVPLLVLMSFLFFALLSAAPGDPTDLLILGNPNVTAQDIVRLKRLYGLDAPLPVRYSKWLVRTIQGDLGWSLNYKVPVRDLIRERLPHSIALMTTGLTLSLLVAVPIGIYSALRQYSFVDYVASVFAFIGFSLPLFWFGLIMIYVFAVKLQVLPPGGVRTPGVEAGLSGSLDYLRHMVLPAVVVALYNIASLTRYTRSSMLEVIRQDYIRTARAKGLAEATVIRRHAIRNALVPIVTILGLTLPLLFGGAPVTETVFAWPGIGQLLVQSVVIGDHVVAISVLMMIALVVLLFNLATDLLYAVLDPRIRYG